MCSIFNLNLLFLYYTLLVVALLGGEDMLPNQDIRDELKKNGIFTWELARELQIHETTLYRYLRNELSVNEKEHYQKLIIKLTKGKEQENEKY